MISPVINIITPRKEKLKRFKQYSRNDTEFDFVNVRKGSESIESWYDIAYSEPFILERVKEAQKDEYDAIIIDCFSDPGLYAARQAVDIPVAGLGESSMLLAKTLGFKFSILTPLEIIIVQTKKLIELYGFSDFLASVRSFDMPVLDIRSSRKKLLQKLIKESKLAKDCDGADVILLGCGATAGLAQEIQKEIEIPVIDSPGPVVGMAEMMVLVGTGVSRKAYPFPPDKNRVL